jgi:CheY-like chemotaxis protein
MPENQASEKSPVRILAAVNDLFFAAKISAAAKRVGVPVEFVRSEQQVLEKALLQKTESLSESSPVSSSESLPTMLLLDLNDARLDPVALVAKLKADPLRKDVRVIGFLSHVQTDLIRAADQAGCDLVLPRSVFSQQLDDLLRQHSCHL